MVDYEEYIHVSTITGFSNIISPEIKLVKNGRMCVLQIKGIGNLQQDTAILTVTNALPERFRPQYAVVHAVPVVNVNVGTIGILRVTNTGIITIGISGSADSNAPFPFRGSEGFDVGFNHGFTASWITI
jgi:hypothetical protein